MWSRPPRRPDNSIGAVKTRLYFQTHEAFLWMASWVSISFVIYDDYLPVPGVKHLMA
jgi:hypothetical protein